MGDSEHETPSYIGNPHMRACFGKLSHCDIISAQAKSQVQPRTDIEYALYPMSEGRSLHDYPRVAMKTVHRKMKRMTLSGNGDRNGWSSMWAHKILLVGFNAIAHGVNWWVKRDIEFPSIACASQKRNEKGEHMTLRSWTDSLLCLRHLRPRKFRLLYSGSSIRVEALYVSKPNPKSGQIISGPLLGYTYRP